MGQVQLGITNLHWQPEVARVRTSSAISLEAESCACYGKLLCLKSLQVQTWHSSRILCCGCCLHPQGLLLVFAILLRLLVLLLQQGMSVHSGCRHVAGAHHKCSTRGCMSTKHPMASSQQLAALQCLDTLHMWMCTFNSIMLTDI